MSLGRLLDGQGVNLISTELLWFVGTDFGPMRAMCDQAGLSERAIYDRTKDVMEFFGFPSDVPPPERGRHWVGLLGVVEREFEAAIQRHAASGCQGDSVIGFFVDQQGFE